MFSINKGRKSARFLRLRKDVKSDRRFTAALWAEYLNNTPARDTADAKSNIKRKYPARDHFCNSLNFIAQPHYRSVAELASYFDQRLLEYVFSGYRIFLFGHSIASPYLFGAI